MRLVYLDVCCLSRLFDDQRQLRIRIETEAVLAVLRAVAAGRVAWLVSTAVDVEIARDPSAESRRRVAELTALATVRVMLIEADRELARTLEASGLGALDALHLTAAERGAPDVLLTTDDRFVHRAARLGDVVRVPVLNPARWAAPELRI